MKSAINIMKPILMVLFHLLIIKSYPQIKNKAEADSAESYRIIQLDKNAKKLQSLRQDLVPATNKYVESFTYAKKDLTFFDYLSELRGELKSQIIFIINNSTSGEAIIAVCKAKINLLVAEINIIENNLGEKNGVFTNELNAFAIDELKVLKQNLKTQIAGLAKDKTRLPPSEMPTDLLLRLDELNKKLLDVDMEIKSKEQLFGANKLKEIDRSCNSKQLKNCEQLLEKFNSSNRQRSFEDKLKIQIELRLHSSYKDASLVTLKNLPELEGSNKQIIERVSAKPPPSKWENPIEGVLAEICNSLIAEQDAIELRNSLAKVYAQTNTIIYSEWLKAGVPGLQINSIYELLSVGDLELLKSRNTRWLVSLHKESLESSNFLAALEIKETEQRIAQIEKAILQLQNNFPLESSYLNLKLVRGPPLVEFESKIIYFEKYIEAKELRLLLDRPTHITNLSIKKVYDENILLLKKAETVALVNCKGEEGAKKIEALVRSTKLIVENRNSLINYQKQSENYIKLAIKHTNDQIAILTKDMTVLNNIPQVIYYPPSNSSKNKTSQIAEVQVLKQNQLNMYSGNYDLEFPKNEPWTKSRRGLMKDINKAPGGIIIDAEIKDSIFKNIENCQFNIFTSEIKILIKDEWKKVALSKDWTILRQAWAYVNDERVAAIDIRYMSSDQVGKLFEYLEASSNLVSLDSILNKLEIIISSLSLINLHPAFQNTSIGNNLILADKLIFDIFSTKPTKIEGEKGYYRKLGLDMDKLWGAYILDMNSSSTARSLIKSIILDGSVSLLHGDNIHLKSRPDFGIYRIPNKKSRDPYIRMYKVSNWFNTQRAILSEEMSSLKVLDSLSTVIAFFKAIKKNKVHNNFSDLIYLLVDHIQTPNYLFSGNDKNKFQSAVGILEDFLTKYQNSYMDQKLVNKKLHL